MRSENIAFIVFKTLFFDTVRDIIRFPIWWYTKGLIRAWKSFMESAATADQTLGVSIWFKNILKPMYGQYDLMGRFISIIIRLFQLVIRTLLLLLWIVLLLLKVALWGALPVAIFSQLFYQMAGGFLGTL